MLGGCVEVRETLYIHVIIWVDRVLNRLDTRDGFTFV